MDKQIAKVEAEDKKAIVTFSDVKKYLCPKASEAEIIMFLKLCESEGLNPWKRDCYIVKYTDDQPAAFIIATHIFLRAAESCPEYDGFEAGIILKDTTGKLEFREGSFLLDEEEKKLVGGWAKVYREDRQRPIYAAVNIKECIKYTKTGRPTRFWDDMPATMVRKVALTRAHREAFPNRFGDILTTAEFEEIPEGQLPAALEKGGKPDWKKFWARVKSELGLTTEEARELLRVASIKEELIDAGWTMEKIWDDLVAALQRQKATEKKPEQVGEVITQEEDLFGEGEEAGVAAPAVKDKPAAGAAAPAKPKRDPMTIKTLAELMKACFEDFKMQPKEVIRELGYNTQFDITESPAECYLRIASVRGG